LERHFLSFPGSRHTILGWGCVACHGVTVEMVVRSPPFFDPRTIGKLRAEGLGGHRSRSWMLHVPGRDSRREKMVNMYAAIVYIRLAECEYD